MLPHPSLSCLAGAAKDLLILALNHLNQLIAGRSQIFARIELGRIFGEYFADNCRYRQPAVTVDINFTNSRLGRSSQLFGRDSNRVVHFAAEIVDHTDILRLN